MDEQIHFIYHFGGKWVNNNKGMQYVGGAKFKMPVGYDVDRLGFWNIHGFYAHVLGLDKFRLWFRLAVGVDGDEGGLLEIKDDKEVVKMIEHNKKHPLTDVYGVEDGGDVVGVDELRLRLEEAVRAEDENATPEIFDGPVQEGECGEGGDDRLDEDEIVFLGYGDDVSGLSSGVGDVVGDSVIAAAAAPRPRTRASVAASRRAFFAAFDDDYAPRASSTKAARKEPVVTQNR